MALALSLAAPPALPIAGGPGRTAFRPGDLVDLNAAHRAACAARGLRHGRLVHEKVTAPVVTLRR